MSSAWTDEELRGIGGATELQVASRRPDGTLRPYVTIWGVRSVSGVLIAGLGFFLVPYFLNDNYSWLYLLTGLGAIGISRTPEGVVGDLISRFGPQGPRFGAFGHAGTRTLSPSPSAPAPAPAPAPAGAMGPVTPAMVDGDG